MGDIHTYRETLFHNPNRPIDLTFNAPLSGAWAPDGRNTSPLTVVTSDHRNALLSSFTGLPVNGSWTLQAIDFHTGGVASLNNWGFTVSGIAVPEPAAAAAVRGLALGVFALARRLRRGN